MKRVVEFVVVLGACVLLSLSGCGSVTERSALTDADGAAGAPGTAGEAGGAGGTGGGSSTAGATGTGGVSGTGGGDGGSSAGAGGRRDAGIDACVSIPGKLYCVNPCPAGVPLATCPVGTVKAGPDASCPTGDQYEQLYDVCVPSADAGH